MVIGIDDALVVGGIALAGAAGSMGAAGISANAAQSANALSFEQNKELMQIQHKNQLESNYLQGIWNVANSKDYTSWLQGNSYLNTRRGLERAGYNPILAYSSNPMNGSQSIGAGSAAGGSVQPPDYSSAMNHLSKAFDVVNLLQGVRNIQNTQANTQATNASVSLVNEQAKSEQYRQKQMEAQTTLTSIDSALRSKEVSWYEKRQLAEIKTMYMNAQANHLASEAAQLNAHTAQANYNLQKGITDYENVQRQAIADWYKQHPIQKGITTGIGEWTGALGNIFKGNFKLGK